MSSPNPQNTYAVVVGIEKYNKSPNLPGAASSSINFAKWLSDLSVPPGNILLFISELDNNKKLFQGCNFNKKEATRNNIYKGFFEEITQKSGDLLYIFWAGHGFISDINSCRLSYSDDNENFNLSSLLKSLRSKTFPNFNKQIILIDACAIYATKISSKHFYGEQLYKEEYAIGGVKNNNEQVVLLASKEGHTAKYEENTGLFSKVLLEELQGKQKLLLPEEMRAIQDNVVRRFEKEYNNEQKPISFYFIDKDGNQIGLNKSAKDNILVQANWERLKPILSKIDGYKLYLACWLLLSESTKDKDKDIDGNYPKINTLKSQYTKVEETPDILWEILFIDINQNQEKEELIFIILKFVVYLTNITTSECEQLKKWQEEFAKDANREGINVKPVKEQMKVHIINLKQQYKSCRPYLMINYEPNIHNEKKVCLAAELIFQENNNKPSLIITIAKEMEYVEQLQYFQEQLDNFIIFTIQTIILYGFTDEELIIEMFLPDKELIKSAEQSYEKIPIKIDNVNGKRKWISGRYKFTLRSWSRLNTINDPLNRGNLKLIKNKWDQLNNNPKIEWVDYQNNIPNDNNSCTNIVGIGLLSTTTIFQQKDSINDLFRKPIEQGLPLFVWMICDEIEQLKEEVTKRVLTEQNLTDLNGLLKTIKDKRSYSHENYQEEKCWGYYLSFLCDNPYRLPSKSIGGDGGDCLIFGF